MNGRRMFKRTLRFSEFRMRTFLRTSSHFDRTNSVPKIRQWQRRKTLGMSVKCHTKDCLWNYNFSKLILTILIQTVYMIITMAWLQKYIPCWNPTCTLRSLIMRQQVNISFIWLMEVLHLYIVIDIYRHISNNRLSRSENLVPVFNMEI